MGTVDIANRRPGRIAILAVHLADEAGQFAFDVAVLLDVGAALRRDLQERHVAAPLRIVLKQPFERLHPVRNAFRIVEAIDAKDELVAAKALAHQRDHRRATRVAREAHVRLGLDAHREGAEPHFLSFEFVSGSVLGGALGGQVVSEIVAIVFRLETDQIVIGETAEDFPVVRQGLQNVGRRTRRVKKKSDGVAMPARTQLASQQHQMIIVHPDNVVLPEQRAQAVGEHAVDADVAAGVGAGVLLQIDPVVKDRPQHAVGEAVVIFLNVVLRQIDEDIGHLVDVDDLRLPVRLLRDLAAPAEPHSVAIFERSLHRNRHAPGEGSAGSLRHRHAVGDDDQSRAHASSQLDDSRVALLMMPAMEYV